MRCILSLLVCLSLTGCSMFSESKNDPEQLPEGIWQELLQQVGGRLVRVTSPLDVCDEGGDEEACAELWAKMNDPFFLQSEPGTTQSVGWLNGWTSTVSDYAVLAESVDDVVAAVNFAREHDVKLVVRGAGHSYQGRSCAPDSLLLWTRDMNRITMHDDFVPEGAPADTAPVHAVTAEAGTIWAEAYTAVTTLGGRYVQGGGCPTVGVAGGFLHSGGFGSYSKYYGTAAASWIEAEVVLASGEVVVANEYQNSDLFWALRGGGGCTFGVVTKATLQTYELPESFGLVVGTVKASSDEAYRTLLTEFFRFCRKDLLNRHWGEKATIGPDNSLKLNMRCAGLTEEEVRDLWYPFMTWVKEHTSDYESEFEIFVTPAQQMWSYDYWQSVAPERIVRNEGYDPEVYFLNLYFWEGASHEASAFWHSMQSRWIPKALFKPEHEDDLVNLFYQGSRLWGMELQFNKGLAEVSEEVRRRETNTSLNPVALDASLLVISGAFEENVFPGIPGHEPDIAAGEEAQSKVNQLMDLLAEATPGSGSFSTQSDYFQKDWQNQFWGTNYPRLLEIKQKYDPEGLFRVHHGVGSEL